MVVFRNFQAIDSQPRHPTNHPVSQQMYNCISNTIEPLIPCECYAHAIYLNMYILFIFFPPPSIYSDFPLFCVLRFRCFAILWFFSLFFFFDQDSLKVVFSPANIKWWFKIGPFSIEIQHLYIRFDGLFVSPCRFILNVFRLPKLYISKYRFTFRFYCIVSPLYHTFCPLFRQFILCESSELRKNRCQSMYHSNWFFVLLPSVPFFLLCLD